MSASFASAMMNARDERLALISASLASSDFTMPRNRSLHPRHDLVRDRLHRSFGLGVEAGARSFLRRHSTSHSRTPFIVVAKLALLQTVARVGDAETLLDVQQVLELRRRKSIRRLAQLRRHQHRAAIRLDDFHFEIGV